MRGLSQERKRLGQPWKCAALRLGAGAFLLPTALARKGDVRETDPPGFAPVDILGADILGALRPGVA